MVEIQNAHSDIFNANLTTVSGLALADCNCIVTRGGVYDEILPEPEGNPMGGARGIS